MVKLFKVDYERWCPKCKTEYIVRRTVRGVDLPHECGFCGTRTLYDDVKVKKLCESARYGSLELPMVVVS